MALLSLNSTGVVADLRVYLGSPSDWDEPKAKLVVALAMERCAEVIDPVPALARAVVLDVAARGYSNPLEVQSESENVGPFARSRTYGNGSVGVYLREGERKTLENLRDGGTTSAAFTIRPGGTPARRAPDAAW